MTSRQSIAKLAAKLFVCFSVAAGLTLAGCTSDSVPPTSSETRAAQQASAEKGIDQTAKGKSGKSVGPPTKAKSIKGLIKKEGQN